ncbi:unnamed protein product [Schistosoma mattheei]|uniref:Uncharacterized protein n=1 Tax=Schistosoma mattheei TaxID=31246 RepID=A0A183P9U5_9TREM|nr:unnamed protein product [Schistosoma mattheei]
MPDVFWIICRGSEARQPDCGADEGLGSAKFDTDKGRRLSLFGQTICAA